MDTYFLLSVAAFFLAVLVLLSLPTIYIPGRSLMLMRVLFPSWRFFEDVCEVPQLYVRTINGEEPGEWLLCRNNSKRTWYSPLINPEGNLELACNSLLNQVQYDIEDWDESKNSEFADTVSYQLLKNLAEHRLRERGLLKAGNQFQFKLTAVDQATPDSSGTDVLVSRFEVSQ